MWARVGERGPVAGAPLARVHRRRPTPKRGDVARTTPSSLTVRERQLLDETKRANLATLDEDEIGALLTRVRRVRDKEVSLHRAEQRERASTKRARGAAAAPPTRSAWKVEVFEEAVARVSSALARAARASAKELKAERLAAARSKQPTPRTGRTPEPTDDAAPAATQRGRKRAPIEKKVAASTQARGARRQAKRDTR